LDPFPCRAPDGGLVIYTRDVDEIKKTEQALQRAEHLAIAGRLAASIAHELNNSLEAVTNLLFLAKSDSSLGLETRELLEIADKELQRLSHVASSSLKFYRQTTAPTNADMAVLLDSVLFLYNPRIRTSGIELEKKIENTPLLYCLSGELQQVFANLIGNALDALDNKGKLYVGLRPSRDWKTLRSHGVRVTIADSGKGMSRETRKRLFEPFFTTKREGTGLGLWVANGILHKHGANVSLRSRIDGGTVFSLFFPTNGLRVPTQNEAPREDSKSDEPRQPTNTSTFRPDSSLRH
jgi:signal transduction histidine kinase